MLYYKTMTITENYSEPPQVSTRTPSLEDLDSLKTILEKSLIDAENGQPITDEIESVLERISLSIESSESPIRYRVAESSDGQILGVMGITRPDEDMAQYAHTPETCVELVNAFVDPSIRKTGAGRRLVEDLLADAKEKGATEVVVNSGPRYKQTGWPFWAKVISKKNDVENEGYGETALLIEKYGKDLDGKSLDAMVWRADI